MQMTADKALAVTIEKNLIKAEEKESIVQSRAEEERLEMATVDGRGSWKKEWRPWRR